MLVLNGSHHAVAAIDSIQKMHSSLFHFALHHFESHVSLTAAAMRTMEKREELHVLLWQLAKWLEFSTQVVHNYSRAIVLFIDTIVSFIGNKTKIHCLDNA